jgi:hypothetical protein
VRGAEFLDVLKRLIGRDEAERCLRKISAQHALDRLFHEAITNAEALAFYVYATANGWHSYINAQLWSEQPDPDVQAFASILDSGLRKIAPISGKGGTVYRGYRTNDLSAFAARYAPNSEVIFPAFTSASFSEAGAFGGNVLFIIRVLSGRAIWWLSPNFHEEEALLPTGCRFIVIDSQFRTGGPESDKLVVILQEMDREGANDRT